MGLERMSFEQCMEVYEGFPLEPAGENEDDMLNGIGFFKGYLWQEAERQLGDYVEEFPLVVDALTCAAIYDRDPAEALLYVIDHVPDAERDSPVYGTEIIATLVRTTELLPEYVDIRPLALALEARIPGALIMDELIINEDMENQMTDAKPEQGPTQARTYEQAVQEGDPGMAMADIFPDGEDWQINVPDAVIIAAANHPGQRPDLPSPDPDQIMD